MVTNNCVIGVNGDNFRIEVGSSYVNGLAQVDVYPGCELLLTNHNSGDIDVGANDVSGGTGATNILNIWGLVEVQGGGNTAHGALRMGNATDVEDDVNLLAGGVLHVNWINPTSTGPDTEVNFNGGTLRVYTNDNASTFLQGVTSANVLDGGAIIDTAGFLDITVGQSLLAGGTGIGGLTKQGLGTLLLTNANTYTGPTLISVGGLGGFGTIVSPVTVATGASLLAGSSTNIGTFTINNTVTFDMGSSAEMKISKTNGVTYNDNIAGVTTMHYNGTLVVLTNVDQNTAFAAGDTFTLFNATTYSGSFGYSLPTLPTGLAWNTSQLVTNGSISIVTAPATPPKFNPPVLSGANLILGGSGGLANGTYYVVTATNLMVPLPNWTVIATNTFDASGNFSITNAIVPGSHDSFFDIWYNP